MNTNGLAKLYGHLTPRERLPLLVAAAARGDEAERSRLVNSAPATVFKLPDYHALGEALELLGLFHLAQLLDLATRYWHASGMLGQDGWMSEDQDEEVRQDDVIHSRLQDTKTPDYEVAFDPDEAERIAFREDALSDQDACESAIDF